VNRLVKHASAAATVLIATQQSADAHIIAARLGDFYTGALHPFTDLQGLLLWVAMGVLAGSLGAAIGRWLVIAFPLGLLAGMLLGLEFGVVSSSPIVDAGMIVALGLPLVAKMRLSLAPMCAIALALAVVRGAVNAGDVGPETNLVLYAAGLATAGYVAITLTMALAIAFTATTADQPSAWRDIAIRIFGSWIAAIGLMMGAFALAS
jgi:urease accessory protein